MNLRLVSSNEDRALAIRVHLLPVVRDRGTLERQCDAVRQLPEASAGVVGFRSP
jgi:hypothetical protein